VDLSQRRETMRRYHEHVGLINNRLLNPAAVAKLRSAIKVGHSSCSISSGRRLCPAAIHGARCGCSARFLKAILIGEFICASPAIMVCCERARRLGNCVACLERERNCMSVDSPRKECIGLSRRADVVGVPFRVSIHYLHRSARSHPH
jgi:hypothetical protein